MRFMHDPLTTSSLAVHGMLAAFGALVHAAKAHRAGETKTLIDFLTLAFVSSFTGVMFAIVGFHFFADQLYITLALAGTGGYLGVEGMSMLVIWAQKIIAKK